MNIAQKNESYIQTLKPTVWIGKNGCTDEIINEIKSQLESRKIIKIKWLQNSDMDYDEVKELAVQLKADVIDERGRSVVLGAKNRGKSHPADEKKAKINSREYARSKIGYPRR